MLKKAMPLFLIAGMVLGGCTNNGAIPKNNETPMENVDDRTKDWTPKVRDEKRGGTNLDGLEENQDGTGTGVNEGIINEDNTNNNNMDGNNNTPREDIMEDDLDRKRNNENNMNNR